MADKLGNCRNLCSAIWGRWHSKISGHQHEQGGECQGYLQVAPIAIPFPCHDGCIASYCTYCTHQYFNPLYFTSQYFTLMYCHQSVSPPCLSLLVIQRIHFFYSMRYAPFPYTALLPVTWPRQLYSVWVAALPTPAPQLPIAGRKN